MRNLVLKNIRKAFGGNSILDGLSTEFEAGRVTAIVGDNGAGKSTLMKCITGAVMPESGSLFLDGENISSLNSWERRKKGVEMVYQDLALAKQQDVVSNLFLGREIARYGFLRRRDMLRLATEKLFDLGITLSDFSCPVGKLSGGQQQAIAIARAAVFDPRVILFDEPTAALAAREVSRVLELIKEQKSRGRIVLLVSHRLNDVFEVADRILVLKRGRIDHDVAAKETTVAQVVEKIVQ